MATADDVLVVDDDGDMREVLEAVLHDSGFRVRTAANGVEALTAIAEHRPALVLLDLLMPIMDGATCAQLLRERYGDSLPIVVMTAAEHAGRRALEVGATAVLAKPIDLEVLLTAVRGHVPADASPHP